MRVQAYRFNLAGVRAGDQTEADGAAAGPASPQKEKGGSIEPPFPSSL